MVPEGWERVSVRSFGGVSAGRQRSPSFVDGKLRPYLRVANVFESYIDTSDVNEMHFTDLEYERYRLEVGDILLNEGQSTELVGRPAMYKGSPPNCCFQNTLVRFKANDKADPSFALQRFLLCLYDGTFRSISKKTTSIAHLGVSRFADLVLLWPPLTEQKKIARILSTWDKAITTTERLIEASQQQKRALMQQLLTGKRRLPGFQSSAEYHSTKYGKIPSDWSFASIEKIASPVVKKNVVGDDLPVLSCSKYDGFVDSLKYFKKKIYSDDTSIYKIISREEFGFPANHIEEGSIGWQNLYDEGLVSPIYVVFKIKKEQVDGRFLYSLLKTEHYRQIFASSTNASVDRRGSLRWQEFSAIKVQLPSLDEQKSIALVLTTADREIEALRQKLDCLKQEKKALMQLLLTGKRRVKVEEKEDAIA